MKLHEPPSSMASWNYIHKNQYSKLLASVASAPTIALAQQVWYACNLVKDMVHSTLWFAVYTLLKSSAVCFMHLVSPLLPWYDLIMGLCLVPHDIRLPITIGVNVSVARLVNTHLCTDKVNNFYLLRIFRVQFLRNHHPYHLPLSRREGTASRWWGTGDRQVG